MAHHEDRARAVPAAVSTPGVRARPARRRRTPSRPRARVPLPRLRRRGPLEPGQAGARLPVLRHRVAGDARDARRRDGDRRARPRRGAARRSRTPPAAGRRRRPPCAARAARRSRSSTPTRSASAATSAARPRSCRTSRSRTRSGPSRCCRSRSAEPQARDLHPRLVQATAGSRPNRFARAARSPTRSRASTCRTGRSTPRPTRPGPRRRATTTTSTVNGKREQRVRWTPASGSLSHVVRRRAGLRLDAAWTPACCAASSRSRRTTLDPLRPGLPRRLGRRALPDRPRGGGARRSRQQMDAQLRELCAAPGARRHPAQPGRPRAATAVSPSSTSWRRCGW